jgi:signal transduction histidine kinase
MIVVAVSEPEALSAVTSLLMSAGLAVWPADSGGLALESITSRLPDLVLLDIGLSGMDALEVCQRIKANEKTRDIPVIFLSPATESRERVPGLRLGATDFICKPIQREELFARISPHLELAKLRRQMEQQIAERTVSIRSANEALRRQLEESEQHTAWLLARQNDLRKLADGVSMNVWVTAHPERVACEGSSLTLPGDIVWQLTDSNRTKNVHADDVEQVRREFAGAVEERRAFRVECRVMGAAGGVRWVLHTGIPRLRGGAFAGYIGSTVDITDLKRNHERMIVSEKFECLGHLAAGLAHDFNNLVGSIFAASDLALSDLPDDSPARTYIERINTVATRASEIVTLLLTYAGEYGARTERLDLSLVVAEMAELLKGTAPPKIAVTLKLAPDLPEVRASVTQVRQVILNLMVNAFEALQSQEGSVAIMTDVVRINPARELRRAADGDARARHELADGDYCRLVVADNGCGMTPDVHARAFDPFYSTKFIGRGLGLAVVQGIVRSLGGAITMQTAPGRGAAFEVLLPCSVNEHTTPSRHRAAAADELSAVST